jgi:hypothetical protein
MGRPALSPFVETLPEARSQEDLAARESRHRAVVFGLLCVLISAMLSIGAIAWLIVTFG